MASKYRSHPPAAVRTANQSGFHSNAKQAHPNGMEFSGTSSPDTFHRPEAEQYYSDMQNHHWEEQGHEVSSAEQPDPNVPYHESEWGRRQRVEASRFIHRPVTGRR